MWCDASPATLKIAELASPHASLSPAIRQKQLRMLLSVLCDRFTSKDTVKMSEMPMFQQKQGLQAHDDSTRTGSKGAGEAGPGTAHDSNMSQAGHNVWNSLRRLAGCGSGSTGKSY